MKKFPFEASPDELTENLDGFVDALVSTLESEFLTVPRGEGFVEYSSFESAFQELKRATGGFDQLDADRVSETVFRVPLALIVLRTMLGFTPPEWAYVASPHSDIPVTQGYVRSLDRGIRIEPQKPLQPGNARIHALVRVACELLSEAAPEVEPGEIHRLDKADTRDGVESIRSAASIGIPYSMLLYERLLGRPFAGHRDSVSELIGGGLETAIEERLDARGVSFRKTKRAETISGFDQAPDFVIPDEFAPKVIIEAKLTQDDGTARDKVTRVQHLDTLSRKGEARGSRRFQVIACIAGRGFGVRREDMKKLLLATDGKVFTSRTLDRLVECSRVKDFATSRRAR